MKKQFLSLFIFILFTAMADAADGYLQEITQSLSLLFPGQPQVDRTPSQVNYTYQTDSIIYLAQFIHYREQNAIKDSATLTSFYNGLAKGILRGTKGTILKKELIPINNLSGLELVYVRGDTGSLPVTICARALILNGEIILYSFSAPTDRYEQMKPLREKFLSSISFSKDTALTQYHSVTQTEGITTATNAGSTDHTASAPVSFMSSRAGLVIKVFIGLILLSALIYFLAAFSRRKE